MDLGSEQAIDAIVVWNRTDGSLGKRLDGFTLTVLDANRREVFKKNGIPAPAENVRLTVSDDSSGEVLCAAIRASVSMNHEPEMVFAALMKLIVKGEQVPTAARGIRVLPHNTWPKEQAGSTAVALVAWAKHVAAEERMAQDYIETVQLASDLAGLLPVEKAAELRQQLKELRVSVFVIRTVREQMRYDTPQLVVEAGKPFEIIIENVDFMPHNLAVVKPGAREKVGAAAALMKPEELDGEGRAYIPQSEDILAATRLLEPRQKQTLKLTAPTNEGDHEYVCTFPGHYQNMWGRLVVTKDVEAYLQAHPEPPTIVPAASGHVHQRHQHGE